MPVIYVVSGLPASGKTRLARALAEELSLPVFDKDDILEALFDTLEQQPDESGLMRRQRLSRASDHVLQSLVNTRFDAVVVSFWRHPTGTGKSGTPVDWLVRSAAEVVEIFCDCSPDLAQRRFSERVRHPGHCDAQRGVGGGMNFAEYAAKGPLGIGRCFRVNTAVDVDVDRLVAELAEADWKPLA